MICVERASDETRLDSHASVIFRSLDIFRLL